MRISIILVFLFFFIAGCAHFVRHETFVSIMPPYLPFHFELVIISGVAEIVGALMMLHTRTRVLAACGLTALCVAVLPANIHMALNPDLYSAIPPWLLWVRLPLQLLIIFVICHAAWPELSKTTLVRKLLVR